MTPFILERADEVAIRARLDECSWRSLPRLNPRRTYTIYYILYDASPNVFIFVYYLQKFNNSSCAYLYICNGIIFIMDTDMNSACIIHHIICTRRVYIVTKVWENRKKKINRGSAFWITYLYNEFISVIQCEYVVGTIQLYN